MCAGPVRPQNYVLMLHSTLSRSQYDYSLTQVSFVATGYHKHVTLTFNPTVRDARTRTLSKTHTHTQ